MKKTLILTFILYTAPVYSTQPFSFFDRCRVGGLNMLQASSLVYGVTQLIKQDNDLLGFGSLMLSGLLECRKDFFLRKRYDYKVDSDNSSERAQEINKALRYSGLSGLALGGVASYYFLMRKAE